MHNEEILHNIDKNMSDFFNDVIFKEFNVETITHIINFIKASGNFPDGFSILINNDELSCIKKINEINIINSKVIPRDKIYIIKEEPKPIKIIFE